MSESLRHRLALGLWISLACMFSIGLVLYRMERTGTIYFSFLLWNLLLALIPIVFSALAWVVSRSRWKLFALLFLLPWLLFFPNAPYILTDLLHLKSRVAMPLWYDMVMLLSFGLNGLFLGYISLVMVESVLERLFNRAFAVTGSLVFTFAAAYGIYLGRYHRMNSWDVWTDPLSIAHQILDPLLHPLAHARVWAITFLLGFMIYIGYRLVRELGARPRAAI
jgi:uncharacterized membrane protein